METVNCNLCGSSEYPYGIYKAGCQIPSGRSVYCRRMPPMRARICESATRFLGDRKLLS